MPEIIKSKKEKIKKNKPQKPAVSYIISVLKGFAVSFAGLILISFLLINNGTFTTFTKIFIYVVIGLGALLSGFISNKKLKGRGIVNGLLSSAVYLLIYMMISLIVMRFQVGSNLLLLVPVVLLSGIIGGILSANS